MLRRVVWQKFANVSKVLAASIALIVEAANTFETSVNFYQTILRSIREGSHLHARRRENLKSQLY
jgi:hypothetical protein